MTLFDIEKYCLRLNTVLDCTMNNQITVGNVTLPKAVLSTVKIFAVQSVLAIVTYRRCDSMVNCDAYSLGCPTFDKKVDTYLPISDFRSKRFLIPITSDVSKESEKF